VRGVARLIFGRRDIVGTDVIRIDLAKHFSETPGGRLIENGPFSGEEFRERHLEPLFQDPEDRRPIEVILDGVEGLAASFLEEAFGGLARTVSAQRCMERLRIICQEDPATVAEVEGFVHEELRREHAERLRRRVGKFYIQEDFLCEKPDLVLRLMGQVLVVRCEHLLHRGRFEYIGLSDLFEECPRGGVPPEYDIVFIEAEQCIEARKVPEGVVPGAQATVGRGEVRL
jgi:hypothetical protein